MNDSQSSIINSKSQRSWHHRMARLVCGSYYPKCPAADCYRAGAFICEWDMMRYGQAVTGQKLYCPEHAGNFALKHNIYMADLPEVLHSQLATASRDDWRYSEDQRHREGHGDREANSQSSIVNRQFEEAF